MGRRKKLTPVQREKALGYARKGLNRPCIAALIQAEEDDLTAELDADSKFRAAFGKNHAEMEAALAARLYERAQDGCFLSLKFALETQFKKGGWGKSSGGDEEGGGPPVRIQLEWGK